jgi:hypothetical protein
VGRISSDLVETFAIAFGVVLGGSFLAALAALFTSGYPTETLLELADRLKVWGMAAAIGGTLRDLRHLEEGILRLEPRLLAKELVLMTSAFAGSVAAYYLLLFVLRGGP